MRTLCWYDKATSSLRKDTAPEDLPALLKNPNGLLWMDVLSPDESDLALLTSALRFHPLTVEDCLHPQMIPKVEMHKDYLFIVTHAMWTNEDKPTEPMDTQEMDLFVGKNFVVTVHDKPLPPLDEIRGEIETRPTQMEEGAMVLAYRMLDKLVDLYMPVMNLLDDRLMQLERTVRSVSRSDMTEAFFDLHHAVTRLQRISRKQEEVFLSLTRKDHALVTEEDLARFQDIHDHMIRLLELTQSYRENLNWILDTHLALVGHRTNDIMRILTIYNMVLLPLGFITSFYGMNFDQPETHWAFGYPFVVAVMAAVLLAVWIYFRRKEWV